MLCYDRGRHIVSEGDRFRSSILHPKTDSGGNQKKQPDDKTHGLTIQRKILLLENRIPAVGGQGAPLFRYVFSHNVLPLSLQASLT